jgi:hypothetical protein
VPYQPRATFDNPYGPQVAFRTLDVLPPAAYYVAMDDQVVLDVYTDHANASFQLVVRVLNPQGSIQVETVTLNNFQAGLVTLTGNLTGMEGYLLSACLSAPGLAAGEAYCRVRLVRNPLLSTSVTTAMLIAGYVSDKYLQSYPGTPTRGPLEGPGKITTVSAAPAAGADWTVTCPIGERWKVLGAFFYLVTSATVATRVPVLRNFDASGHTTAFYGPPSGQAASLTVQYAFTPGGAGVSDPPFMNIGGPVELWIENGGQFGTFTENLQPADQFTYVNVQVERWIGP